MPPTNNTPQAEEVDKKTVEKTGDTTTTTKTHDAKGTPDVHTEEKTVEKPKE